MANEFEAPLDDVLQALTSKKDHLNELLQGGTYSREDVREAIGAIEALRAAVGGSCQGKLAKPGGGGDTPTTPRRKAPKKGGGRR